MAGLSPRQSRALSLCSALSRSHSTFLPPPISFVSLLCCWFDSLFSSHRHAASNCLDANIPFAPEPAPLPLPPAEQVTDVPPPLPVPDHELTLPQIAPPSAPTIVESPAPLPLNVPAEPKPIHGPVVELRPTLSSPPRLQRLRRPFRRATPSPSPASHPHATPYPPNNQSCLLSPVSCPLSPVPCLLSPVSCLLSPVPCPLSPVSCLLIPRTSPHFSVLIF